MQNYELGSTFQFKELNKPAFLNLKTFLSDTSKYGLMLVLLLSQPRWPKAKVLEQLKLSEPEAIKVAAGSVAISDDTKQKITELFAIFAMDKSQNNSSKKSPEPNDASSSAKQGESSC